MSAMLLLKKCCCSAYVPCNANHISITVSGLMTCPCPDGTENAGFKLTTGSASGTFNFENACSGFVNIGLIVMYVDPPICATPDVDDGFLSISFAIYLDGGVYKITVGYSSFARNYYEGTATLGGSAILGVPTGTFTLANSYADDINCLVDHPLATVTIAA